MESDNITLNRFQLSLRVFVSSSVFVLNFYIIMVWFVSISHKFVISHDNTHQIAVKKDPYYQRNYKNIKKSPISVIFEQKMLIGNTIWFLGSISDNDTNESYRYAN